jgi:transposase
MDLTNSQWERIAEFFPTDEKPKRGRPRQDPRKVINGILWICRTGAPWKDLPSRYPSYQTCHRYFQEWNKEGLWDDTLFRLAQHLKEVGKIDIDECFIDGTFSSAKKGGIILEKLSGAKAPRSWQSQTLLVFLSPYGPPEPIDTK